MPLTQVPGSMISGAGFASLSGITFPATQVPSTDANTLDDYEEGTWTPTVISGITSPTYGTQASRYTKIGRICYFSLLLSTTGGTRNSSILSMTLPFSTPNLPSGFGGGAYWAYASAEVINSTSTNLPTLFISANGNNRLDFYATDGNGFNGTNLSSVAATFYIVGWMECA